MPVDSEEIRMLAQCRTLERRLTAAEERLITKLENDQAWNSETKFFKHQDGENLRFAWERITDFGKDEAEAARGG